MMLAARSHLDIAGQVAGTGPIAHIELSDISVCKLRSAVLGDEPCSAMNLSNIGVATMPSLSQAPLQDMQQKKTSYLQNIMQHHGMASQ